MKAFLFILLFFSESRTFGLSALASVTSPDADGVRIAVTVAIITAIFRLTIYWKIRKLSACQSFGSRLLGKIFAACPNGIFGVSASDDNTVYRTTTIFIMRAIKRVAGKIWHDNFSPSAFFSESKNIICEKKLYIQKIRFFKIF